MNSLVNFSLIYAKYFFFSEIFVSFLTSPCLCEFVFRSFIQILSFSHRCFFHTICSGGKIKIAKFHVEERNKGELCVTWKMNSWTRRGGDEQSLGWWSSGNCPPEIPTHEAFIANGTNVQTLRQKATMRTRSPCSTETFFLSTFIRLWQQMPNTHTHTLFVGHGTLRCMPLRYACENEVCKGLEILK